MRLSWFAHLISMEVIIEGRQRHSLRIPEPAKFFLGLGLIQRAGFPGFFSSFLALAETAAVKILLLPSWL